jgi:hypothetical protein
METTDLAPTLLHLLGQEPDPGMTGRVRHDLLRPPFVGSTAATIPIAAPHRGAEAS